MAHCTYIYIYIKKLYIYIYTYSVSVYYGSFYYKILFVSRRY